MAGALSRQPGVLSDSRSARVGSSRALHATTPSRQRDPYSVLGLEKTASAAEIKRGYYQKAKQYHPDANKDDPEAAKKFAEATSAYEVLGDEKQRAQYDQYGSMPGQQNGGDGGFPGGGFGGAGFGGGGFQWQGAGPEQGQDIHDLLNQLFGGGSRKASQRGPRRGRDVQVRHQRRTRAGSIRFFTVMLCFGRNSRLRKIHVVPIRGWVDLLLPPRCCHSISHGPVVFLVWTAA